VNLSPLLILFLAVSQETPFREFGFCREGLRPADPARCLTIDAQGTGVFRERNGDDDAAEEAAVEAAFVLSAPGMERFLRLLGATGYLEGAAEYESGQAVANMGQKVLSLEGDFGRREGAFNYTSRSEVTALVTFLDRLIAQEAFLLDLEFSMEFSRLELPTLLEELQTALRGNRFADPPRLLDALRRIGQDPRVVNYARETAVELAEDISKDLDE
jgi:hypothetical protein